MAKVEDSAKETDRDISLKFNRSRSQATTRRVSPATAAAEKRLPNGDLYTGTFLGNVPNGSGKYLWADGCMYEGEWKKGKATGKGKFSWPSGAAYEGEFKSGRMEGSGTFTGSDGGTYRGYWVADKKHGFGEKRYANGDLYEGSWRKDVQDGHGRYVWKNGNEYFGEWKNGLISGKGVLIWANGNRFEGNWENGVPKGNGNFSWGADGGVYIANCKSDCKELVLASANPKKKVSVEGAVCGGGEKIFPRICICDSDGEAGDITCEIVHSVEGSMIYGDKQSRKSNPACFINEGKKPGRTISKGHKNYDLMLNLQQGIRFSIGRHASIKRDLKPSDFDPKEKFWTRFPPEGSKITPTHQSSDFWWKDYCPVVFRNELEAEEEAAKLFPGRNFQITQDPDDLDTWFSSGLFPLSVLGWPDETADLRAFYPTSVLETGHDILFFWVARMVMLCTKLGGDVPVRKVYLHPMIRDAHGRKMSNSLGNVIDPFEVINGVSLEALHKRLEEGNLDRNELAIAKEGQKKDFPNGIAECGADALRFALISYTAQSDKINLDIQRVVGYRQWCNKLWNATRFAMSKLGDGYAPPVHINEVPQDMPLSCKWILSVLNNAIDKTVASLEKSEFSDAANAVYSWWQYQLCDVFIEVIKPYFSGNDQSFSPERKFAQDALWISLDTGLRLLHPFMPFITEELWQRLPQSKDCTRKDSIMISEYPSRIKSWENENAETRMNVIESTVKSLRSLKSTMPPNEQRERRPAYALCRSDEIVDMINSHALEISTLAGVSTIKVIHESRDAGPGCAVDIVNEHLSVYLKVKGAINADAEREKMRKKMHELKEQVKRLEDMMSASGYKEKVPPHVHKENEETVLSLKMELLSVEEASQHLEQDIAAENQA